MLAGRPERRRRRALAGIALAVLLAHAALLLGAGERAALVTVPGAAPMVAAAVVEVSSLAAGAPVVMAVPDGVPPAPATAPAPETPAPPPHASVPPPAPPPPRPMLQPRSSVVAVQAPLLTVDLPASAAVGSAAGSSSGAAVAPAAPPASAPPAAPEPAGEAPPIYRTRMPPPATLQYTLQRGALSGTGELRWRPDGERYELQLEGRVLAQNVLTQRSEGRLDAAGVAPQRFTDRRLRRPAIAANFQRETGRISFSGVSTVLPLRPGVQDRVSWMVQLAAIAAAEPQRLETGETIVLEVVGARGDAGLWTFRSLGRETLALAGVRIETVHLQREPRAQHDTAAEVWLDPARHHLPVRAMLRSGDDEPLDLRLREPQ